MIISEISINTLTYFQNHQGYILPEWATVQINIERALCEIFKEVTNIKDIRRRIEKFNLTYEMLTDKESFNYFNEKFYRPYMKKRYGDEAFLEDLNRMWETARDPMLIAIRENGVITGMALLDKSDDVLHFRRLGLLDGNSEYLHHGVVGAIYYFVIIEGQKMNCRYIGLGGTRPFLTDGLTRYKVGWGAEFLQDLTPAKDYLWLGIKEQSSAAREFLQRNPFMHLNKDFTLIKYTV